MAQFNQLQTSASQVVNPPADFISFYYDESKRLRYFNEAGPLVISASMLAFSASLSERAIQLAPGDKVITGSLTVSSSLTVIGTSIISGTLEVTRSINSPEISASFFSGSKASVTEISSSNIKVTNLTADTASVTYLTSIYETSSISYSSGSNKFGDALNDVHEFTGSVYITGSLTAQNVSLSGSFSGSGHNLFDISASAIVGLNLARISTASVSASVYDSNGTGSFHVNANTFITGAILANRNIGIVSGSGSFSGSGANLYDISASAIVGLNLSRIATGSFSASVVSTNGTGSFQVNVPTVITGSLLVQSSSAGVNIIGTASWAVDALYGAPAVAVSDTYPTSQRNIETGSASGSLWWNTNDGNLYIQAGGPSGSTWVPAVTTIVASQAQTAQTASLANDLVLTRTTSYANDAAAAAAGVPLFGVYRNGGSIAVRIV
jgi:hypothetical protein